MKDLDIKLTFKRIQQFEQDLPEPARKLYKGLRSWYKKTGGLSMLQIKALQDIERQVTQNRKLEFSGGGGG